MKRILILIVTCLLVSFAAQAAPYGKLWKKYERSRQKDLPQTSLSVLSEIMQKAESERAYGHLLKAQFADAEVRYELSPDSLLPAVRRIESAEQKAAAAHDEVLAAIYRSTLGSLYGRYGTTLPDAGEKSKAWFKLSMSNPDALAKAFSNTYEPYVVDGIDSKYYYDDMLHIIGMLADDYYTMHRYYDSHGKREGACLTALEIARKERKTSDSPLFKKSRYVQTLDSLLKEYADLLCAGEIAVERYEFMQTAEDVTDDDRLNFINYSLMKWGAWPRMNRLRNECRRLTLPSFHVACGNELMLPGVRRKVDVIYVNNIGELKMTMRRLRDDAPVPVSTWKSVDYDRLSGYIDGSVAPYVISKSYVAATPSRTLKDSMYIPPLSEGLWLVEMTTDNVAIPAEYTLLRVTNLYPVTECLPDNRCRVAVLNATTGEPVPHAKVDIYDSQDISKADALTLTCDDNGEIVIDNNHIAFRYYCVRTDIDNAFPLQSFSSSYGFYKSKDAAHVSIFTDRSIYRHGQTVHVAAVAYRSSADGQQAECLQGEEMELILRDANRRQVDSKTVRTDEFGTASADFVLPAKGLDGRYSVEAKGVAVAYCGFSVEDYKRPTFRVDVAEPATDYHIGDTLRLSGRAETFTGLPVTGARVELSVTRRPLRYWRCSGVMANAEVVVRDTLKTDSQGAFTIAVPMVLPESYDDNTSRYYSFDIVARVTDLAGETRSCESSVPLSDRRTLLTCDIATRVLRDSTATVSFNYINNAGKSIDAEVDCTIGTRHFKCRANERVELDLADMPSGKYRVTAVCGSDSIQSEVTLFSLSDSKVPTETHDWFWISSGKFPADGSPVYLQVGSSDSIQHVLYTALADGKVVQDGRADIRGELLTTPIYYREEWGDGLSLSLVWVKQGKAYTHNVTIRKPVVDKSLSLQWETFRDRLVPGKKETWTLRVTSPDGTPARAQLIATLYDKSLDEIQPHALSLNLPSSFAIPFAYWSEIRMRERSVYGEMLAKYLNEPLLQFSHFAFNSGFDVFRGIVHKFHRAEINSVAYDAVDGICIVGCMKAAPARTEGAFEVGDEDAVTAGCDIAQESGDDVVRTNLDETAFFMPALQSNAKGELRLTFTLPESVTTWQFHGVAHDREMNIGHISAQAVASKTVMVTPNVPRFVRAGDKGVIAARVSSQGEKVISGTAVMQFLDPESEKVLYSRNARYTVKPGETVAVEFAYDMSAIRHDGLLICRVKVSGGGHSDGEQHYLPVLPVSETVVNSLAFTCRGVGKRDIDLTRLLPEGASEPRLTVEYVARPEWLMIQTLPYMSAPESDNAFALVSALYSNSLGKVIMHGNPAIRAAVGQWSGGDGAQGGTATPVSALENNAELRAVALDETPWVADATGETGRMAMLADYFDESRLDYMLAECVSRLARLQHEDGSFSWWKGMNGSPYVTQHVLETLVRCKAKGAKCSGRTAKIIDRSFAFMEKYVAEEVVRLKKLKSEGLDPVPGDITMSWLYAVSVDRRVLTGSAKHDFDYLIKLIAGNNDIYSIYGKSMTAVTLALNGRDKDAAALLESMKQHTVSAEGRGRWFDTGKAKYSWRDYRIPTQVAAIEALQLVAPEDSDFIADMRQWLLLSKRTQMWDTPVNTVNAVYAFFGGGDDALQPCDRPATLKVDGRNVAGDAASADVTGYVRATLEGGKMQRLVIDSHCDNMSWGAVHARFMQESGSVAAHSEGFTVKRQFIKDGRVLADGDTLAVGDRITVRITVTADRDYDFVHVADRRAACMEPSQQISGYVGGCYQEVKDNVTNYYFDTFSKGRHVLETAYYVDRSGTYSTGTCLVQCAYSPEFAAREPARVLSVK